MSRPSRSEDAQAHIKQLILDRRLAPGDALPTETELTKLLDISRNSVREALKALQAMRIVDIRHGFGTYVGSLSLDSLAEGIAFRAAVRHHQGEAGLYELMAVREALETGLISSIAGALPPGDLASLRSIVDTMRQEAEQGGVAPATDRAFHSTLYGTLGNHLLSEVLDAFWSAMNQVRAELHGGPSDPLSTWKQHQAIVTALETGDRQRAAETMHRHFDDLRTLLSAEAAPAN
ncbi:FadR/GntR family transcriptional regulator [Streptomyces montanisoli]|uniref:FadR family transcriptional regulator n=1 Tax=Streptomyces montanisoli TaxID=2798581 RepID=A0A940M9N3_9ACTN|nr:FadR/GntR family transcriptional regulator [Streptomyces montanisoli]MBP0456913.1 FadR family transcriptional regulator [Streptomyces montanisoli]